MGAYTHNHVVNGNLELWDAGPVPREMDAQVTNTTVSTLDDQADGPEHPARHAWADIRPRNDKYVYEGFRSLRATIAAAAVVDAFRLFPEGTTVNLNTASAFDLRAKLRFYDSRYAFTFAARCSVDGNLVRVRLGLRDNTDALRMTLTNTGTWTVGATTVDFGMRTTWRRYGIVTDPVPIQDGAGNIIENMVWQISNGTAAAQVIDLDDIQLTDLGNSYAAP
jgi:hypothetical protein